MTLSISEFPGVIICEIFKFLNFRDLANCCKVSKLWNRLASSPAVWATLAQVYLGLHVSPSADLNIKSMVTEIVCLSNDQIVRRLQKFLNRCSLERNGRFRCILGSGQGYRHITLEIKRYDRDGTEGIAIQECYLAPQGIGDGHLQQPEMTSIQNLDNQGFLDTLIPRPHVFTVIPHVEPNYTTIPPSEQQYRVFVWRTQKGTSFKIFTPHSDDLDTTTPLEAKMEHMVVRKANGIDGD